jgi:hypothetical protein
VLLYFISFVFLFVTFASPSMCVYGESIPLARCFWRGVGRVGGEARFTFSIYWRVPTVNFLDIFLARAVSVLHLFRKLSPYLAVRVTVNYVDNFRGFNE